MSKKLFVLVSLSIFALAACSSAPAVSIEDEMMAADQNEGAVIDDGGPSSSAQQSVTITEPASTTDSDDALKDGDLYLEALAKTDLALCAKIGDASLRATCESDVKAKQ
ncbi:hypothetical protein CO046_01515 [Candidatus Peregrinibacteria bacterium CG_4_9_14_0_2_um_filter_53_11]|nr:MAG: hypothetical protein CO046_01515 [Candidatus Peregrinibacteria bacterium CG_4_9_14_0_2_um_filter_53_11]